MTAVLTWRTRALLCALAAVLVFAALAVTAQPADAHGERALHRALNRLDARIDTQAQRITSLRNRLAEEEEFTFALLCVSIDVWNNLNAEPNLTLGYPDLDPCATAASAGSLKRMMLARMR